MPHQCAILDDYQSVATTFGDFAGLEPQVRTTVFAERIEGTDALVDRLRRFSIIVAMRERTPFPAELFDRLPNLRLLVTTGMRNAAIDLDAATARGVLVCGTEGSGQGPVELTFALMFAVARHLDRETTEVRQGGWQSAVGVELHGRTLGVVGVGRIGAQVAAIAKAFGMRVTGWSRNLTDARCRELGIERSPVLEDLLQKADFVSVHLKLGEQSRGLIGARELSLMKPDAYLINTARGPIVDEAALVDALERRAIAGAGLDVFDTEPLPAGHPFRLLPNVVATPHIGYVTREAYRVFYGQAVEDIKAWLAGNPVRCLNQPVQ